MLPFQLFLLLLLLSLTLPCAHVIQVSWRGARGIQVQERAQVRAAMEGPPRVCPDGYQARLRNRASLLRRLGGLSRDSA